MWPCVFSGDMPMFFLRILLQVRPGSAFKKFFSRQVLLWLVRSSCLRVWVDDVFVVSFPSLLSCFFKRESSGLTGHHTPPIRVVWFFLSFFVPAALVCSPILAVRPFCSVRVPFWALRVLWILSGLL